MDVYEVTGYRTGVDRAGVNFLDPADAFEVLQNGFIYRQVLQSRLGFSQFADRLDDGSRVMGIFENVLPDSTKELLVFSKEFLYVYNSGTDQFDQVAFTSVIAIAGFGITNNEDYISGTTYLTKSGTKRFVFTSRGMNTNGGAGAVYFYESVVGGVKLFTNAVDNPDFQQPAASIGNLLRATMVAWFGERLNLFVPETTVAIYNQGILYSGIRDASGNGDKFNVPGSGMIQCDTYELMKGALINGDIMIMNFQRSNWALEKTRDAFNPYFVRKIPSVLGTDAGFSAVSWAYEVKSAGKTGMVTTDGRRSLRFDDKIPYLTQDEIDQSEFELTYGGFDRVNEQFLFAYRDTTSNLASATQDKVLIYNYKENTWAINDQRFSVFGQTDLGQSLTWDDIDETENPSWARMDETEEVWNKIGITASTQKTLAGDDIGFVYQINQDYDDYFVEITAITQASSAVVTVDPCALQVGDRVIFANVGGMTEIEGMIGNVTAIGTTAGATTSITVDIDSTNFTAYTTGGTVSKLIAFEAEMSPFNPYRQQGRMVYVSHIEFLLNTHGGNCYVDLYEDEEEAPFKPAVLLESNIETTKERQWIPVIVDQEANFITVVMRNESAATQTIITSIRFHCSPGAFTSS